MRILVSIVLLGATALSACGTRMSDLARLPSVSVYELEISQGNIVTPEMLAALRRGMERRHVRMLIGTPMIADPFHADRWDYPYSVQVGNQRQQRIVSLHFEDDRLDRVSGDVVGSHQLQEPDPTAAKTTVAVPPRPDTGKRGWLARLLPLPRDETATQTTTVAAFTRKESSGEDSGDGGQQTESTPPSPSDGAESGTESDDGRDVGLFDGLLDRVGR